MKHDETSFTAIAPNIHRMTQIYHHFYSSLAVYILVRKFLTMILIQQNLFYPVKLFGISKPPTFV